jgi:hypothetical protein
MGRRALGSSARQLALFGNETSRQPELPHTGRVIEKLMGKKKKIETDSKTEAEARDAALDMLAAVRCELVMAAREAALQLAAANGRVTSTEVFAKLRAEGWGPKIAEADPRWMGVVFRTKAGWERIGWETTGSHKRPVAVWKRAA